MFLVKPLLLFKCDLFHIFGMYVRHTNALVWMVNKVMDEVRGGLIIPHDWLLLIE